MPREHLSCEHHTEPAEKACAVCGRRIEWRRKWADDWAQVRYCSAGCRRRGVRPVDHRLEDAITGLLEQRKGGASICPSEAARSVDPDGWRELMEPTRMAARRLVDAGAVEMLQKGAVVDPSTAKGPVRIRRA
ncbi:DUF3253 domain-containing protein [Pseudonocardia phyllosphaerae]|uniref:DUF3253 domain-containing protein n=1 Tax=Pseudonocardia phyllosphaerae TaxID=3390502 RepID=UPI00397E696C